jgi:predicted SAM-dependent methyltransferase
MISFFTTTKNFTGINATNQLNAIRSWLASPFNAEVIIFGKSEGFEQLGSHPNLKFFDQVKVSESGAPYANEMFDMISRKAKHDICCFINADILLTDKFFLDVIAVHTAVKSRYMIVGERIDVDVKKEILFSKNWEHKFIEEHESSFVPHPPAGSDFFVFPKGQFHSGNMPELLIGRPGWDLWMIYNARKTNLKTIDLSFSVRPYHLNHDYSHIPGTRKSLDEDEEAILNLKEIPEPHRLRFVLNACNYFYANGHLKKSYSRENPNNYVIIEKALGHYSLFSAVDLKVHRFFHRLKNSIFLKLLFAEKRKFNIGAAKFGYENGWLFTDIDSLNITKANDWKTYLRFLKLDKIVAEHVWEHLSDKDTELANKNCFYFLKKRGVLRLAVPDGLNPDKSYIEWVRPGGSGAGAYDHKILYTYKIMKERLEHAGFTVDLLEYWDENGIFHFKEWSDDGGRISRSKRYDPRNQEGKLNYTSLIVDAVKL